MLWHMKTTPLRSKYAMNLSPMRLGMLLIPPALACFALAPQARADCLQGCNLTRFNTFLGADALLNNTSGTNNTATGAGALTFNTTGFDNTATGSSALTFNTTGDGNTAIGTGSLNMNTTTRLLPRSGLIRPVVITRALAVGRSPETLPATPTPNWAILPGITSPKATPTLQWAIRPACIPMATTTLILAM